MATQVVVDGPAKISIAPATTGTLAVLGYTRNGVDITFRSYTEGVPSDLHGGELGPPIDVQFFGETADINLMMTKWDITVMGQIQACLAGETAGTHRSGAPGKLYFGDTLDFRLLINPQGTVLGTPTSTRPYNFPHVIFQHERQLNKGTRFSQYQVVATAYVGNADEPTSVALYNATTS